MDNSFGFANDYGKRVDGSPKGSGFFGPLSMLDKSGDFATELSASFNYGFGDVLVPLINPSMTEKELIHLLEGKPPTEEMLDKAGKFGFERIIQGKTPFITSQEQYKTKYKFGVDNEKK